MILAAAAGIVLVKARRNAAATRNVDATTKLDTQKKQVSYAMGVAMARSLQKPDLAFDADLLACGVKDAFSGKELLMGEDALRKTMTAFEDDLKQKQSQALKAPADANRKRGEALLAENAKIEDRASAACVRCRQRELP